MNTENQTPLPPEPQHPVSPDSQTPPSDAPTSLTPDEPSADSCRQEAPLSTWRHNGKVARLPKDLRDKINLMIQDGVTYPAILQNLGEAGKGLNIMNLSRWKDTGYKDWLLEQTWLDQTRARQETGLALSTDFDATHLNHAALQVRPQGSQSRFQRRGNPGHCPQGGRSPWLLLTRTQQIRTPPGPTRRASTPTARKVNNERTGRGLWRWLLTVTGPETESVFTWVHPRLNCRFKDGPL